jgi:hypothetical protein
MVVIVVTAVIVYKKKRLVPMADPVRSIAVWPTPFSFAQISHFHA